MPCSLAVLRMLRMLERDPESLLLNETLFGKPAANPLVLEPDRAMLAYDYGGD